MELSLIMITNFMKAGVNETAFHHFYISATYSVFVFPYVVTIDSVGVTSMSESTVSQCEAAFIEENSSQLTDESADICHSHLSMQTHQSICEGNSKQLNIQIETLVYIWMILNVLFNYFTWYLGGRGITMIPLIV